MFFSCSAQFFSILTSTLNSALQLGGAPVGYLYGGARNVDTNTDAVLTLSATSLNAFMHQLALFPLYTMLAGHQVMMCGVNGMLAIMKSDQFIISLTPAEGGSGDMVVGQCLTVGSQMMSQYPLDNTKSLPSSIASFASNALQTLMLQTIEPFLHFTDAFLSYVIGVVHTLGALVMSQNMANCNPPDFYLQDVVKCACGDDRLAIQASRKGEGLAGYGLWCSGVLSMVDSNNQPFFVYNPYSYAELQAMSSGLQDYVNCVSGGANGYQCPLPEGPGGIFRQQGVSVFNVLVKCRENYLKRRWDPAAYILYNQKLHYMMKTPLYVPVPDSNPSADPYAVGDCMRNDASSGSIVQYCLQEYLGTRISTDLYWAYERLPDQSAGPEFTDACLVFSGPAARNVTPFTLCTDGPGQGNCILSEHVWSPRSSNSVPVAEQHRVLSHGNSSAGLVMRLYKEARDEINQAVQTALDWLDRSDSQVSVDFFSVEGDVLHQTMDCMMMGPYSRVDYWPMPVCASGEECLAGPYWSRDDGGGAGRQVDPNSCQSSPQLPYTCGSPARRSLMKYLVKNVLPYRGLNGNQNQSLLHTVMRMTLLHIQDDWSDLSEYGCLCDDATRLASCCKMNSELLPPQLKKPYTEIPTDNILAALESDLAYMHDQLLQDTDTWMRYMDAVEKSKYDWTKSQRAKDEARYMPQRPVVAYDSSEAMSPLQTTDSTLWDICHACLKQVFFTLPIGGSGVPFDTGTLPFDGDPGKLEDYVRNFTASAFLRSPLYRHYSPRHAPSQSQMCWKPSWMQQTNPNAQGTIAHDDYIQMGETIAMGASIPKANTYDAQSFLMGEERCMCGWEQRFTARSNRAICRISSYQACVDLCQDSTNITCVDESENMPACSTANSAWYYKADEPLALAQFSKSWTCPEVELSPHWGFMDPDATEQWLGGSTTLTTRTRDLLEHGRAGLRIGNIGVLQDISKDYISPLKREVALSRGVLTTCNPGDGLGADLTRKFVDQLFPTSQAAEESGAMAYCMRYVIELARLEALSLMMPDTREHSSQRESVGKWAKRCNSQLQVLRLCKNLGVYRPPTHDSRVNRDCPHFQIIQDRGFEVYATPACLVNVDGAFYDPCRCMECKADSGTLRVSSFLLPECEIRFDPRGLVREGPIGWYDGVPADDLDSLLVDSFEQDVLGDPDATGNVQEGSSWWDAEGFMHDTGEFCDGVLDWWPDDWDYPVGYHVTVPCMANDTAYRSFVQSFSLGAGADGPTLVYQHDILRDSALVDTNFGAAGLCRTGTFGMPMPETNTMRYCTRVPNGGGEDFTLPGLDGVDKGAYPWTQEQCTATSRDLPWPSEQARIQAMARASSSVSVGTVPNMPSPTAVTYPESFESMMTVGPIQELSARGSWGLGPSMCSDPDLYYCSGGSDRPCPDGFACRGRVCSKDLGYNCVNSSDCQAAGLGTCQGACIDTNTVDCIKHSDCTGDNSDQMCSGLGVCTQPVLVVHNRLQSDNVSFSLASQAGCDDDTMLSYDLQGASFWAYTGEDLMRAHGMCSFEDWYKYRQLAANADCAKQIPGQGYIEINPAKCPLLDMQAADSNSSRWWPPGKSRPDMMFVRPTDCDRDYERLQGFRQCAPRPGKAFIKGTLSTTTQLAYDRFIRLHNNATSMPLALMPFLNETKFGFLGLGFGAVSAYDDLGPTKHPFVPCASLHQCYAADFSVNGMNATRTMLPRGGGQRVPYPPNTPFKCGVFGVEDGDSCRIDMDVVPLYRYLCDGLNAIDECTRLVPGITGICSNTPPVYQQSSNDRTTVLEGLQGLFYAFRDFTSIDEYLDTTTCMKLIFDDITLRANANRGQISNGLYYPTMFALYEFPFEWFYQCMVMGGWRVNPSRRLPQDCQAFAKRNTKTLDYYTPQQQNGDPWDVFLRFARGGYIQADVDAFMARNTNVSMSNLRSAIDSVKRQMYSGGTDDKTYPQCSVNKVWKVGDFGREYVAGTSSSSDPNGYNMYFRDLIWDWYDTSTCHAGWTQAIIDNLNSKSGIHDITTQNWIEMLTTYDPVNVVPMDQGTKSMLEHISEMVQSFMVISSSDVGLQGTSCIQYNSTAPDSYNFGDFPLDPGLKPRHSPTTPLLVSLTDNQDMNRTCVYKSEDDPAFNQNPTPCRETTEVVSSQGNRVDKLRKCGPANSETVCSTIPVAAYTNGMYMCRCILSLLI